MALKPIVDDLLKVVDQPIWFFKKSMYLGGTVSRYGKSKVADLVNLIKRKRKGDE